MSLADLEFRRHYDSDEHDVLAEFYRPALDKSIRYDRAVGYFSSSTLKGCAIELRNFVRHSGKIRLVVGCLVSKADIEALTHQGIAQDAAERAALRDEFLRQLDEIERSDFLVAQAFAKLVASEIAELRFAFRSEGIYHEKFGIFEGGDGFKVAFIGSMNETASALTQGINHESFSVYQSKEPVFYSAYGEKLEERFESLWNGQTKNTRIVPLDDESLERIKALAAQNPSQFGDTPQSQTVEKLPARFALRPYQLEAIQCWQDQGFKGILAMATGTGKTLTAIDAVKRVKAKIPGAAVVITVPYQNLAIQWIDALRDQGLDSIGVFDSYNNWYDRVRNQFAAAQYSDAVPMACVVCVNASFKDDRFQGLMKLLEFAKEVNHLLVVDECHHFNKPEHLRKLPEVFSLRLGLSATPYDQFSDVDEGQHLARYFGKIAFEFPLGRAIDEGFLTRYQYHFFCCELDFEETERYVQLTHEIIKIAGSDERFSPETLAKVQPKLLERARIVGAARDKLAKLKAHLTRSGRTPYTLFYCGDGAVEEEGESNRQIEVVSQMLHELGWRTSRITAKESLATREQLLRRLGDRSIDAVVSIKVLDEGIDVPACQAAYLLANQSSNRQWIQRRGRVLRLSNGKEVADIYDFLVLSGASSAKSFKSLAKKELKRAYEFARDAVNAAPLEAELTQTQEQLGIILENNI
jgi:superfamily II DNA or RNA helicase